MTQKDTKLVVSLGGGGIRMYAHSVLLKFLENMGVQDHIDEIWGSSGGAFIGFYYSIGMTPEEMEQQALELVEKKDLSLTPSVFAVAKNILLETLFSQNSAENLKGFHDLQQSLTNLIKRYPPNADTRYPFYVLAYNLEKNQTDILTPHDLPQEYYNGFIHKTNPFDAIVASSSVPILFKPKVIDDENGKRTYSDGATGEEIPTVSVYKKWLHDREMGLEKRKRLLIISVDLHPDLASLSFLDNWLLKKIPAFEYILMTVNLTDLMRRARIEEQKRILINDPNVELWELDFNLKGGGLMNVGLIPQILKKAQHDFTRQFTKLNDELLG